MALIFSAGAVLAQQALPLTGDVSPIHDPTIVREKSNSCAFSTDLGRQKVATPDHTSPNYPWGDEGEVLGPVKPDDFNLVKRLAARRTRHSMNWRKDSLEYHG